VGSQVAQGVSSAATTAAGAQQLENDPVAGATQMVSGAAGVAGAAGVEDAEQVADAASAASSAAQAAQAMEHDPVGGLLGMVEAGAAAAGAAGAQQQATQAVSSAASAAQSAIGAAGSAQGAGSTAQGAASSARAARAQPAAAGPAAPAAAPSSTGSAAPAGTGGGGASDQASWQFNSADRLHVRYSFQSDAEGGDGWRVQRVVLEERMDRPYEAVLDLSNDDTSADPLALLGQPAVLTIERHAVRDVHGVIRRVERGGGGGSDRSVTARVHLVPALWTLSQTRNTRVFQEKAVKDILQEVLEAGLGPFQREVQFDLQGTYQPREYCMQWEESDLDFCHRLMQEEGMWYHFDHSGDAEKMVIGDTASSFEGLETQDGNPVPYTPVGQGSSPIEAVMEFLSGRQLVPNKTTVREYDWTRPATDFKGEAELTGSAAASADEPAMEEYFHGPAVHFSQFSSPSFGGDDIAKQADLVKRRRATEIDVARATSELTLASPGQRFELTGHPHVELDREWFVVAVRHEGQGAGDGGGEGGVEYVNHLELMPADVDWRPRRTQWKRRVHSVLTATVVGPSGEEIHTDVHGRIKVQFHWDREGQKDDHSSCFIRSMQPWAGQGWGFVFLPRIGMEVVVTFVDGDIDRPLVIGSVYNGQNPPPYALPDDKTKSTIKSNSSPGGDGFNELRFEDAAGSEEIFIHAQKDMNEVVLNNHTRDVGADESIHVAGNRSKSIDVNETITIKGHQQITIQGEGNPNQGAVKGGQMNITGKYSLYANDEIIVEAPNKITLKVPGSSIVMEPGKITLTSGDKSTVVLDANVLAKSSGGSSMFLDANANFHANGGGDILLDANAVMRSNAGSHVTLDANALTAASAGAQANLTADATVSGTNATLSGTAASTVSAPTATLQGGAGSVEASASGVSASGPTVNIAGAGSTSISGAVVKIN
jgi:type VI secretion system secreted protein VgrG